jgi:hypothetical protein
VFVDFDSTLRLNGIATYAVLDGEFAGREFKNQLVLLNDLVPDGETRIPFDRGFLSIAGRCLGDANLDNAVDLEDLLTVLGAFGDTTDAGPPAGDLDGSGITALPDLLEVLSNFATDCP